MWVNRGSELKLLEKLPLGSVAAIFGRRRIGKTELIGKAFQSKKVYYHQAIESTVRLQLSQIIDDLRDLLNFHGLY